MELSINDSEGVLSSKINWGTTPESAIPIANAHSKHVMEHFVSDYHPELGLLPPAVRYIDGTKRIVLFERPPCFQYVEYVRVPKDMIQEGHLFPPVQFMLPIPWTVYCVQFDTEFNPLEVRVFARPDPITSAKDELYLLPLLNFYSNAALCNPSDSVFVERKPTLAQGIQDAYNLVWNSGFNYDLKDAVMRGIQFCAPVRARNKYLHGSDDVTNFFHQWSQLRLDEIIDRVFPPAQLHDHGECHQDEARSEDASVQIDELIQYIKFNAMLIPEPFPETLIARVANVLMASSI